jgi:hypothetical protein
MNTSALRAVAELLEERARITSQAESQAACLLKAFSDAIYTYLVVSAAPPASNSNNVRYSCCGGVTTHAWNCQRRA